jgi:hypothetical protein
VTNLQSATAAFARSNDPEAIRLIAVDRASTMIDGSATWFRTDDNELIALASAGAAPPSAGDPAVETMVHDADPGSSAVAETRQDGRSMLAFPVAAHGVGRDVAVVASRRRRLDPADLEVCASMLVVASAAMRRAGAHQRERLIAGTLQEQLLSPPPMPQIAGLTVAARYRPASGEALVGGDWYDVITVAPRRLVVTVGDVVGHGVIAAGAMGVLRTASRTLADLFTPEQILGHLDRLAASDVEASLATAVIADIDLDELVLRYAVAGHPPPVLVRGDRCDPLWDGRGGPLGLPPDGGRTRASHDLVAGDRILLYTDGLLEQRRAGIDAGLEALCTAALATSKLEGPEACDALIDQLVGASPNDDVALVIVTVT